jgi:hypothetical protein
MLGKRVQVKILARDDRGRVTNRFTTCGGICQSEPQENKHLGIKLQIVVDRMPIEIRSLDDVRII